MNDRQSIDMLIHVDRPEAKERLVAHLEGYPGVLPPGIATTKPHLLFVRHDPARFDIRRVPVIARDLGIRACIVEV
jgi:hypothetical protein